LEGVRARREMRTNAATEYAAEFARDVTGIAAHAGADAAAFATPPADLVIGVVTIVDLSRVKLASAVEASEPTDPSCARCCGEGVLLRCHAEAGPEVAMEVALVDEASQIRNVSKPLAAFE
jgi:hypothetical protein